ncbi:MAG: hypothetical protein HN855_14965 [Anaerolineae bacterium]|jgi:NRPS condensation-like uncharacterized protein|nr:hypothetical protein [Anaerolineae bacterium]MBT7073196.1 hypothetical protein [Anaerolineae bacterium]MBT7326455.1 hypothetical protein [Anaerolineae bacterium]
MLRKLGIFEKAMLIANKHAPFNIVSVLRLKNAPSPEIVEGALKALQERQPLLRAHIVDKRKKAFFEAFSSPELPFHVIKRTSKEQWRDIAEEEMAFRYDHRTKPLFRAIYLYNNRDAELILNVHHAIMDATSGMNLLNELLCLCAGDISDLSPLSFAPAMEDRFPSPHQGLGRAFKKATFALAQMSDMTRYLWRTRDKRRPAVKFGGRGHIKTLILPEDLVDSLARRGRKKGITLNSLLNAALMLATNRHLYENQPATMRTFSFANMRPHTQPPTPPEPLANYISLLGYTADISENMDFWELARNIHEKIYHSLKFGDKFSASLMSESLLKMLTKTKFMRFGATALNYSSHVPLRTEYANIKLVGLHGFVSGYDLGPEIASQARLFNDEIWWDFIYLDTDMDANLAEDIIVEIKLILEKASQKQV